MVKGNILLALIWAQSLCATVVTVNVNPGDVLNWSNYSGLGAGDTLNIVLSNPAGEVQVLATTQMNILDTVQCNGKLRMTCQNQTLINRGSVVAPQIILEAPEIILKDASILNASTSSAGGNIYVGGGWQGIDPTIKNAKVVSVEEYASIHADATVSGPGGIVVLWSEIGTLFTGSITAVGLGVSGPGGDVEVSSHRFLHFDGDVDVSAQNGMNGQLFLDPVSITVQAANPDIDGNMTNMDITTVNQLNNALTTPAGFPNASSIITAGALSALLTNNVNLTLAAQNFITFNAALTPPGTNVTLTLSAPTINLNQPITLASGGTLVGQNVTTINVGPSGNAQNGADLAIDDTTVNLSTATYPAPINILNKNITLNGNGTANTTVLITGAVPVQSARNPAIYVTGGTNVTIQNLTVDGNNVGFPTNANITGIFFMNAGGSVLNAHVTQIANSAPPYGGGQQGNSIRAAVTAGGPFTLAVDSTTIDHFQKAGIVANGTPLTVNLTNNQIMGLGVTSTPAAIGIQLGFGADGTISGNTISGIQYTDHAQGDGILLASAGDNVIVSNNILDGNDEGIISQTSGTGMIIQNNTVSNNGDSGIVILDNNGSTQILNNTLTN
ncbi:MAG: right-handed parallel beta-helix repeat-containing protein, partial [Candidatus Melainabacteria bacterium]|nr:right-handed parallel beta-helix repeat-containing protein [Candidatus Melainabacteria bacterium]